MAPVFTVDEQHLMAFKGDNFKDRATAAAASSERCGVAIICTSWPAKSGSPGFGVSSAARSRCAITAGGPTMP